MPELLPSSEWGSLLLLGGYGVLITLYLVILKILLSCIEQLISKSKEGIHNRSVIDADIHAELSHANIDRRAHSFDALELALAILKMFVIIGGIVGVFVIITLKFNVFFALGTTGLIGLAAWQFATWRETKGKEAMKKVDNFFAKIGGYSVVTFTICGIAFVGVTLALIFLP